MDSKYCRDVFRLRFAVGAMFLLAASLAGCSGASTEKYTPAEVTGQEALAKVLDAWKDGKPAEELGSSIRVADTKRKATQKLKSYEILGELPSDSGRRYQVKLVLENPAEEQKTQYVVVGIDPLWVFRQEDYDMMTHWDHPMPGAGTESTAGQPTAGK